MFVIDIVSMLQPTIPNTDWHIPLAPGRLKHFTISTAKSIILYTVCVCARTSDQGLISLSLNSPERAIPDHLPPRAHTDRPK